MSTFQSRVQGYVGTFSDTTSLSDWLTASAKFFSNLLPENRLVTTDLAEPGTGIAIAGYRLFRAHKNGYNAEFVPAGLKAQLGLSGSIFYALSNNPKAYIENGKLFVLPSGGTGIVYQYPTVAYGDQTITGFPVDVEHGVVLQTAIQASIQKYNSALTYLGSLSFADTSAPVTPSAPSFTYTDAVLGDYTAEVVSVLGSAPSYTDAILGTYTAEQIVSLPAPPAYTKPTTAFDLSVSNTIINTDEDIELGKTELQRQSELLNQYQLDIQNELNEFNKEVEFFKAEMQETIENVRLAQEGVMNLAKDTTNLNLQNAVNQYNKSVQVYNNALQLAIENGRLSQEANLALAKDTTAVSLQNEAKTLEQQISQYSATLQKYQEDISSYSIDVNKEVSQYNSELQKYIQDAQGLAKLTEELRAELKDFIGGL